MATKRLKKAVQRKQKQQLSYSEKMIAKLENRVIMPALKAMRKAAKKI